MSSYVKTAHLRHVWREVNDGNGSQRVLVLEQWHAWPENIAYGYWGEVPISVSEPAGPPDDLKESEVLGNE